MPLQMLLLVAALGQEASPPCAAKVEWIKTTKAEGTTASRSQIRALSLFSAVSKDKRDCLPADVTITALYFDADENPICSGDVPQVLQQQIEYTQTSMLEFRLTSLFEFVRWRSGPSTTALRWLPFTCTRPDGLGNAQASELERAASVYLYATLLAKNGGLATDVVRVTLIP